MPPGPSSRTFSTWWSAVAHEVNDVHRRTRRRVMRSVAMRVAAVLVSFLLVAPALAQPKVPGVTDTEVTLGTSTPLSGPAPAPGNTARGMEGRDRERGV